MPSIEDSDPTWCKGGVSPRFRLADEFPNGVERVINRRPVSPLLGWIVDLVTRFITHPQKPSGPRTFAGRMYDREGTRRYVINLKDVSSTDAATRDRPELCGRLRETASAVKAMTCVPMLASRSIPRETMFIP